MTGGDTEPYRIVAPRHEPVARRESALPARDVRFDVTADVVVVGGGGGGAPLRAVRPLARRRGGPAGEGAGARRHRRARPRFWYWVPNNGPHARRRRSRTARRTSCATARARRGRSATTPTSPTFGLDEWELAHVPRDLRERLAGRELLTERGALPYPPRDASPSTTGPSCPRTRRRPAASSCPPTRARRRSDGGAVGIRTTDARRSRATASTIRTGHRVQRLVIDGGAVVTGVEATTADGERTVASARARRVVFAHRRVHPRRRAAARTSSPCRSSAAARRSTNEGDFVRIARRAPARSCATCSTRGCARSRSRSAVARRPAHAGHVLRGRATR